MDIEVNVGNWDTPLLRYIGGAGTSGVPVGMSQSRSGQITRLESEKMRRGSRRVVSIMLMLLMVLALLPSSAMAAASAPAVSLEEAIQKVKQNFSIPPEYTEFTSSFRSRENHQIWSLSWTDKENREGSFTAEVDAATGVISSMHIYKQGRQTTEIPVISVAEAQNIGLNLLKRLIPDRVGQLQLTPNQQVTSLTDWQGGQYVLHWQRMANQIPVGDEGVTIQINYTDGDINSYDLDWSDKAIPGSTGAISSEEAIKVFSSNEMLELQYLVSPNRLLAQGDAKSQPKLIYRMVHSSGGLIDAMTGEPIDNQYPIGINDKAGMGSKEKLSIVSKEAALSLQEQAEIERTLNLISQEKAVSAVRQWITIPSNARLEEANLYQDYEDPESRIWNLSWRTNTSGKTDYRYFNAQVNAVTGEIRSFYVDPGDTGEMTPVLNRAAAEKIAKDFLQKIQPEKQKSVRLEQDPDQVLYEKEVPLPSQWRFQFTRLENGIPCPGYGVQISVDSRNKGITSYNFDWPEMEFPAPDQVLGLEKASEKYLQNQPLTLHYEIIYPQTVIRTEASGEYKLVYSTQAENSAQQSDIIDAITGEGLAWDGRPVAQSPQPCTFTDIAGHFAEKEISMLGQAGIMTEYGAAFHPQEKISLVKVLRAMFAAQNSYYVSNKSDEEIMEEAVRNKWLKEDMKADTLVTTEMLSKLMVRMLDIEYIAQMSSPALQAPYQDFAGMNTELKGYAALTWGLGIIKGDGKNFYAAHQTTRGEAAAVLVRTLKVAGQRNNY